MANYADDNTSYESSFSIDEVINKLELDSQILMEWFRGNYLKPNPDKFHLILSATSRELNMCIGD